MHQPWSHVRRQAVLDAAGTVAASVLLGTLITALAGSTSRHGLAGTAVGLVVPAAAAVSVLRRQPLRSSTADRVTLIRAVLVGGCATLVVLSLFGELPLRSWPLFALALPAFLLDGVDGWVARRADAASPAGGQLDMETDAVFLVVLSIPLALSVGPWALGIGALRYLFLVAGWWRPALRGPLSFSTFRRVVAGIQGGVLVAAVNPAVPVGLAAAATAVALALLLVSFGRDTVTLEHVQVRHARAAAGPPDVPAQTRTPR